jgi:hypothetical protein
MASSSLHELASQWLPGLRIHTMDMDNMTKVIVELKSILALRFALQQALDCVRLDCLQIIIDLQKKSGLPPMNQTLPYPQEIRYEHLLPHCTLYLPKDDCPECRFALICFDREAVLDAALGGKYYHV